MKPVKILVKLHALYHISHDHFVGYWKSMYDYPKNHLYSNNISLDSFTYDNLLELFTWKNGMHLSNAKQYSLLDIAAGLDLINDLKRNYSEDVFVEHFSDVAALWQLFLRHIIQPTLFPLFDKHVYRAFRYLQNQEKGELENDDKLQIQQYFEEYFPFYWEMEENTEKYSGKDIDDALWAFGKFLSQYPKAFS